MTDSVLNWDSLWDRVEKYVDLDGIETKNQFIQQMLNKFFKGSTNPKIDDKKTQSKRDRGHIKLANELWDRYGEK